MGSDPQSYLEYLDKHCDCFASRRLPDIEKERDNLKELEQIVRDYHFARINYTEFLKKTADWIMIKDGTKKT